MPVAGLTPIENTACNITIRHLVLAGRAAAGGGASGAPIIGLYGGGGFFLPSTSSGDDVLSGDIRDSTLRLIRAMPGFSDRLGVATVSGSVAAPRDEGVAAIIAERFESLARLTGK